MTQYIKGFLILTVLMTLLLYLTPGEKFKKYICFFAELLLTIGLLSSVFSYFYGSEAFLEQIEYEAFQAKLSELSKDMEKIEYSNVDYYRKEYEIAIAEDASRLANSAAEGYGYEVESSAVRLSEDYELLELRVQLKKQGEKGLIDEIRIGEEENGSVQGEKLLKEELLRRLSEYYHIKTEQIQIQAS
ncbi:MAG: stage III sporulation protein AF [Clostridiales bacterium]|nr:stage III sporulation protein AF [Clostridiales bacterium]